MRAPRPKKLHAIAPFFPLEQSSLEHILLQKVHQWNMQQQTAQLPPLIMTRAAVHSLLDPSHVEYLTMIKRSTQKPLLTFSSVGAQFLSEGNPKMNAWQASVKRCLRDWKKGTPITDTRGALYAVLDPDPPSKQGVLYLCPNQDENVALNLLYPPTTLSLCEEQCRFSI